MNVSSDSSDPQHLDFKGTQRFRVVRQIGSGGMGVVYEAEDLERGVTVALKALKNRQADGLLRFRQEFRALQDLEHPNLVRFGELFEEGGDWFFTMELVPGTDFLAHVRPSTRFARSDPTVRLDATPPSAGLDAPPAARAGCDEPRLRDALGRLAAGLVALHDAGKIHRDIKPSNIRVTPEGRVVLLDFGLALDRADSESDDEHNVVGTAAYMAPEQGASRPVGIEADWYAVGVVLYEALVGRLPFEGSGLQILMDKQRREPPELRTLGVAVPEDLSALCAALLRFDPTQRAGAAEVLACASLGAARAIPSRPRTSHSGGSSFVGRTAELDQLAQALDEVRAGGAVQVLIEGESGIGKSALVRRFVEGAARRDPHLVVLSGRCYERESVPYKALDGVLDALGRHLRRLDKTQTARMMPRHAGLLPLVFPSLARVELLAQSPRTSDRIDPQELRSRVFAALRELFAAVALRAPLVLTIDDLQWADADSFALLAEILRPPSSPPILLLATTRSREGQVPGGAALLGAVRRLTLGRLGADEARTLATTLLSRAGGDVEAAAVADEAAGHPLFIDELVRHAVEGHAGVAPVHLDEALWARVSGLEAPARELLEILAVAGGPVAQEILSEALEARFDDLDRRLGLLRVANLARTTGSRRTDLAEPYHDRVREAVFARQPAERRQRLHHRLAVAIEGTGRGDPELLFEQWLGAGETQRALTHGEAAARRAAEALAFDRAARLYRRLLSLTADAAPRRALEEALADALTNAGRGAEAATSFLSACDGATAAEALELRRRAAEQLLRSGHIDEGLAAIRSVLEAVDMSLPPTPRRALASLLFRRARLRLRGLSYQPRDTSQVTASALTRIDVCWSVAAGLAVADPLCASDFQTRNLLLALDAGEPYRIARALAMEIPFLATAGNRTTERVARLIDLASERAAATGNPHAIGLATGMAGLAAYLQGRFRPGLIACEKAEQILRDRCVGVSWELDTVQLFSLECLAYLGELAEMDRRLTLRLREAHDRGDLYALTHLRAGYLNCVWLMRDDPTTARAEAAAAIAAWSQQAFHTQHFYHFFAQQQIDLYLGDGDAAWRRVLETWPQAKRTMLFRIQLVRIMAMQLRGRSSLLAAAGAKGADRNRLLGEAARAAKGIAGEGTHWAVPWALLLQAGVAACRGDDDEARRHLEVAATSFDAADMALYGQIARWRLGRLLKGGQGDTLTTTAAAAMRAQGITNPSRMAAMHAPGFE